MRVSWKTKFLHGLYWELNPGLPFQSPGRYPLGYHFAPPFSSFTKYKFVDAKGNICKNYEVNDNGTAVGTFVCPMPWEPKGFMYCCGDRNVEYCCQLQHRWVIWALPRKTQQNTYFIVISIKFYIEFCYLISRLKDPMALILLLYWYYYYININTILILSLYWYYCYVYINTILLLLFILILFFQPYDIHCDLVSSYLSSYPAGHSRLRGQEIREETSSRKSSFRFVQNKSLPNSCCSWLAVLSPTIVA